MTPDQLIDKLKHSLNGPLPGAKAHSLMAPTGRIINYDLIPDKQYYRDSAVSIILYPLGDSYKCVMIKRPEYDGAHSGQMSFPGGKKDEKDNNADDDGIIEETTLASLVASKIITEKTKYRFILGEHIATKKQLEYFPCRNKRCDKYLYHGKKKLLQKVLERMAYLLQKE